MEENFPLFRLLVDQNAEVFWSPTLWAVRALYAEESTMPAVRCPSSGLKRSAVCSGWPENAFCVSQREAHTWCMVLLCRPPLTFKRERQPCVSWWVSIRSQEEFVHPLGQRALSRVKRTLKPWILSTTPHNYPLPQGTLRASSLWSVLEKTGFDFCPLSFFLCQWLEGTRNFRVISVPQDPQSHPESSLCLDALSPCSLELTNEGSLSSTTSMCVFLIISRWSLLTLILTPVFKRQLFPCHTTEVTETEGGLKYCCSSVSHPEQPPSSFLKPPSCDPLTLVDTSCHSSL